MSIYGNARYKNIMSPSNVDFEDVLRKSSEFELLPHLTAATYIQQKINLYFKFSKQSEMGNIFLTSRKLLGQFKINCMACMISI